MVPAGTAGTIRIVDTARQDGSEKKKRVIRSKEYSGQTRDDGVSVALITYLSRPLHGRSTTVLGINWTRVLAQTIRRRPVMVGHISLLAQFDTYCVVAWADEGQGTAWWAMVKACLRHHDRYPRILPNRTDIQWTTSKPPHGQDNRRLCHP